MKLARTIPTLNFGQQKFQAFWVTSVYPQGLYSHGCLLPLLAFCFLDTDNSTSFYIYTRKPSTQHLWFCVDLGVLKKDISHLTPVDSSLFSASLLEETQISLFLSVSLSVIFYHLGGPPRTYLPSWTHVKTFFSATPLQRDILLL